MIQIDMEMPKNCDNCLMSCRDSWYEVYCRNDMKKHTAGDKDCPLKEVNDNSVLEDIKAELGKKCFINHATDGWVINEEDMVNILDKYISGKEQVGENT